MLILAFFSSLVFCIDQPGRHATSTTPVALGGTRVNESLPKPVTNSSMVVEFNETGSSWGPYQAIFQYGYAEAGIFYSVSGAASLNDPGHRTTALNLTLPDEYYPFWDLDYVGFYNRTGVVSPSETINYPTSSNRTGLDTVVINSTTWRVNRVVSDSITGITNHTRVVNLQTANITQVRLHFASVNLDQDDSLHIFNDTSVDRLGSPPEWSKHDSGSDVWTSWINMVNTTSLHLVLYSNNTSASYTIDYIEYTGSTYSKTLATDKSYIQIVTNPDYIGFNVTLAKLTLPNNSVLAFVDPIGRNMTELWNVGLNQNYTVVNNNSDAGGLWGPSEWIMPEYVNIALYYTDNSSHTPAYLEIGSIEFNRTKGWERYLYPENNVRQFITYSKGTQNVVVNFTRFLNSPDVLFACSSWSFIFTKRPFNTVMTLLDENGTVVPGPDQNLLYNKEYTARFNITDTVNGAPIDAYNIVGHTNTVNLDIWQTNESILQRSGVLSGGLVNFTFTLNGTMLPGVRAGDIKMLVQVHDVNYGAYDNSTSRQAYGMHLFEIPRFTLNCIASEEIGATIATNITTTSGTIYDPNTVTFNLTAYNAYNESGPLNGQPIKVRVFKDTTLRRETYIYQTYHLASNSNFALFTHDFLEEGAWLVTFALLNESLPVPKPEGFYLPTAPLAFSFTIQPRQFTIDITTGSAGLQPAQASEVLVLVTDKEESEDFPSQPPFPLQGWEVNYYFMMLVGSQYQNYFIGSSTTNATGVAKLNWIPPAILAGETIFIKAHAFTKVSERVRFVDESVLVKKGFTLDRLNTSIALRPASDQFYFDDEFTISVDVVDEIGNIVMDRLVAMNLTFVSVLGPAYTYSYTLLTGVNNTRYSFPSAAFLGTVRVDLHFAGSSNYHPSSSNRTFTFDKVNSYIETSIDSFGYHYGEYQKIPINVLVRDGRTGGLFYDNGTLSVEIRDATGGLVEAHDKQIEFLSNLTFNEWNPDVNGLYTVTVTYDNGFYYYSSHQDLSLTIERAQVSIDMARPDIMAGENIPFIGRLSYTNSSPVAGQPVLFEYIDKMGNIYALGHVLSDGDGHVNFTYPYVKGNVIYETMVEFGGDLSITSMRDLQRESAFVQFRNFQIPKCKTDIRIDLEGNLFSTGDSVYVQISLNTPNDVQKTGDELIVDIWSDTGINVEGMKYRVPNTAFSYTVPMAGLYYLKVTYKGSHILEADSDIVVFKVTDRTALLSISHGLGSTGVMKSPLAVLVTILGLLIITGAAFLFARKPHKDLCTKLKALACMFMFLVMDCYYFITTPIPPNPSPGDTIPVFNIGAASNWAWLNNPDLPAEEKQLAMSALGINGSAMDDLEASQQLAQLEGMIPAGILDDESMGLEELADLDFGGGEIQASAGQINNVSLGTYGDIPYPIGDVLNVTFSATEESNYMVSITDINLNRRVKNLFGIVQANVLEQFFIPISDDIFKVGGRYAMELSIYRLWDFNYVARNSRRSTFSVVKGFSNLTASVPITEVYENKHFSVTLREDYSNTPLANKHVDMMVLNELTNEFELYGSVKTDNKGKATFPIPNVNVNGEKAVSIVFKGDTGHYSSEITPSIVVDPITTHLSLSASPVQYSDTGQMTALLFDQYGNKLGGMNVEFGIYIENVTSCNFGSIIEQNRLYDLGNATTNSDGYATLEYKALFPRGQYVAMAEFQGSDIYANTSASGRIIEVTRERIEIEFINGTLTYGNAGIISVILHDDDAGADNPSRNTSLVFSAYYNHQWIDLGNATTNENGYAFIESKLFWKEGDYLLRVTKQEDDRYAADLALGKLTIIRSNAFLEVILNSTQYYDHTTLNSHLTFMNDTVVTDLPGETILYYVEREVPGYGMEFVYIGCATTGANGIASLNWLADISPGIYLLRAFFPGNEFISPIDVYQYGLEVQKAQAKIEINAPCQSPVLDYADFQFNVTNKYDERLNGQELHLQIYNKTNPADVYVDQSTYTDAAGFAYLRWCPGMLGNYTVKVDLVSECYSSAPMQFNIQIIRKALSFNTTINSIMFFRNETCSINGNATFAYKEYDGNTTYLPAESVPLRFYIWNETRFIHPVSGFLVPNMPVATSDPAALDDYVTYTGNGATAGQFDWEFLVPNLQAGRYFVKIRVDTTRTGFFSGEAYISFDLREPTAMSVTVIKSARVTEAQVNGRLPDGTSYTLPNDYYVDEWETVQVALADQDSTSLQTWNEFTNTRLDLLVKLGTENVFYFHYNRSTGTSSLYNGTSIDPGKILNASLFDPQYNTQSGVFSFKYAPVLEGPSRVGVVYLGDRFFLPAVGGYDRIVFKRPVFMNCSITRTQDLYRSTVSLGWLAKNTWFNVQLWDIISGHNVTARDKYDLVSDRPNQLIQNKLIEYYFDNRLMTGSFSIEPNYTDSNGRVLDQWTVPGWIQAGVHRLQVVATGTRVYAQEVKEFQVETWETTSNTLKFINAGSGKYRVVVKFYDQDNTLIPNANYSVSISGYLADTKNLGGTGRMISTGTAVGGTGEFLFNPADNSMVSGTYTVVVDFLGDPDLKFRPSSSVYEGNIVVSGSSTGIRDLLECTEKTMKQMYTVKVQAGSSIKYYYNIQEVRRFFSVSTSNISVNTWDGYGFLPWDRATYVWAENDPAEMYSPGFDARLTRIFAFGSKLNALDFVQNNTKFNARIVERDFVWPRPAGAIAPWSKKASSSVGRAPDLAGGLPWYVTVADQLANSGLVQMVQSKGFLSSVGSIFARYFEVLSRLCLENGQRFSYALLFKLLELLCSGGYEYKPAVYDYTWDERQVPFLSGDDWEWNPDYPYRIDFNTVKPTFESSSTSLSIFDLFGQCYVHSASTVSAGAWVGINIPFTSIPSEASGLRLSMWYSGWEDLSEHQNGIDVLMVDANDNIMRYHLNSDMIPSVFFGFDTIDIKFGEFIPYAMKTAEFDFTHVKQVRFSITSGGILWGGKGNIKIEQLEFTKTEFSYDYVKVADASYQKVNLGSFVLTYTIDNLFIRSIYNALYYMLVELVGDSFSKSGFLLNFFSFDVFKEICYAVCTPGGDFTRLTNALSMFFSNFLFSDPTATITKYHADRKTIDQQWKRPQEAYGPHNKLGLFGKIKEGLKNWLGKQLGPSGALTIFKLFVFLLTSSFEGVCTAIPSFYMDQSYTFKEIMQAKSIWNIFESAWHTFTSGWKVDNLKLDLMSAIVIVFLGFIQFIAELLPPGNFIRKVIVRIVSLGFALLGLLQTDITNPRSESITKWSLSKYGAFAIKSSVADLVIDLVIDFLLAYIKMPSWLKWLLDRVVRLLLKVVLMVVCTWEKATLPVKLIIMVGLYAFISAAMNPLIEAAQHLLFSRIFS